MFILVAEIMSSPIHTCDHLSLVNVKTRAVLSQGGPRDAAVNFDKKIYNGIARFLCHSTAFL